LLNLFSYIPKIKRTRGYRLYDYKGRRYLDCFQNNGAAVLGHRPEKLLRNIKNTLSRGLLYDLPSVYNDRLLRLLVERFPDYSVFRIRRSLERALADAESIMGGSLSEKDIADPVMHTGGSGKQSCGVAFWRPFTDKRFYGKFRVIIPLIPFSLGGTPVITCFKDESAENLPGSDIISPALLVGAVHSLYRLASYRLPEWLDLSLPKSFNIWKREGIYLKALCSTDEYKNVFNLFLAEGVLISPLYPGPTIIPLELSEGEKKKLIELFMGVNGK